MLSLLSLHRRVFGSYLLTGHKVVTMLCRRVACSFSRQLFSARCCDIPVGFVLFISSQLCGSFLMISFPVVILRIKKFLSYRCFVVHMALKKSSSAKLQQPLDPL